MLACLATLAVFATPFRSGAGLIDEVRHALHADTGGGDGEVILRGKAKIYGTDAQYTLRFQPSGQFAQGFDGVLGEKFGDDGTRIWKTNRDGVSRVQMFEDVDEILGETLLLTDRWVDAGSGAVLTTAGNTVDLKLPNRLDEKITIDPASHLPSSASFFISAGTVTIKLSDWREVAGRKYPFHAEVSATDEVRTYDLAGGTVAPRANESAYAMPGHRDLHASFDPGKPAQIEVRRAVSGHLMVRPLVNGRDIGWFIVDSGAEAMCIDPKSADALGLSKVGTLPITGIGGTIQGAFRPVKTFTLGPATMRDVYFVELDLTELSQYFKVPVAGIVGDEYFDRSIVAIDVAKPAISIYDPSTYHPAAGASWTAMGFESGNPVVEAKANGDLTGWYRVDTGDPSTVTFHAPYVQREHLLDGHETAEGLSGGVGGMVGARQGKIKEFELGGHRFEDVDATFSLAKGGAFADLYVAGNIGQGLMRPFTVVFDYGNSRIAFLPK